MYAEVFDDFRRKMLARPAAEYPFEIKRLQTCMKNTPLWDTWIARYLADDGDESDIQVTIEPDGTTYTFYTVIPRKAESNA